MSSPQMMRMFGFFSCAAARLATRASASSMAQNVMRWACFVTTSLLSLQIRYGPALIRAVVLAQVYTYGGRHNNRTLALDVLAFGPIAGMVFWTVARVLVSSERVAGHIGSGTVSERSEYRSGCPLALWTASRGCSH